MAGKVLHRKKRPTMYDQTEKFYEEYRKEQAKNISGSSSALLGLIRDTVKRLDKVIGELNDLRNAVGMSEILLLDNAGVYARAAKLSPAQRKKIAKNVIGTPAQKEK